MPINFDEAHEIEVLRACVFDVKFFAKATGILKQHNFISKPHSWLYKIMLSQYTNHHELPSLLFVKTQAKKDFNDDDMIREHTKVAESVFEIKPASATSSLGALEEFVMYRNLQAGIEQSLVMLEKGEIEKAYSQIHRVVTGPRVQNFDEVKWIEEFKQRQADRKHRRQNPHLYPHVPTRIKALDTVITGIQKGELGLVAGTTGRGKSVFLNHLGFVAATLGWNVVHFTLEMPAEQVAARYDARLVKIPHKVIKTDRLNPEQRKLVESTVDRRKKQLKDKLYIVAFPVRTCTISDIGGVIEQRHAQGIPPDLVLIDSGDHMLPAKSYSNFRLDTASVFWDLKRLASDPVLGCGVWSSTQLKQELIYKIATSEGVSESYDKARIADIILTLNQDQEQEKKVPAEIDLWLAKFRDGESKMMVKLSATLSMMLFEEMNKPEVRENN